MELMSVARIEWADKPPSEPGLYLLKNDPSDYPIVALVAIEYTHGVLCADSDGWETWLSLEQAIAEYPGKWSKRVSFEP